MRRCAGCGSSRPKKEMIRVGLEGWTVTTGVVKSSGRGAYLCPEPECIERARRRGSLDRSLKARVPSEVYEQVELLSKESGWQQERR